MKKSESNEWQGYTLEEMRYQRAASLARCVIARQAISERFNSEVGLKPTKAQNAVYSFLGTVTGNIKFIEYVVLGFKIYKSLFGIWKRFRR